MAPELDLYSGESPNQPPYSAAFVARYRETQIARNRRITAWVKQQLEAERAAGRAHGERAFVVHGTMADPRWLDPAVDPNDRQPGRCYLGDPRIVNMGPVGLARFTTLRSWLSQWSFDDARADGVRAGADISVPVLVIGNSADDACTPSHTQRLFDAVAHSRKQMHEVKGKRRPLSLRSHGCSPRSHGSFRSRAPRSCSVSTRILAQGRST